MIKCSTVTTLFACLVFILILTGCLETISNFDIDPQVMRANPYLKKIDCDNELLRDYANFIIQGCDTDNSACVVNQIYRHIVETYHYISDPENEEIIQTPQETIAKKGGDCEDLSILLISLLENVGLKSYLVLADTHAYALAVDINLDTLWYFIEQSLLEQVEQDNEEDIRQQMNDTISLSRKTKWYYGGNGSSLSDSFESVTFSFSITSNHPITVYVVPSIDEFNAFVNETSFQHFTNCQYIDERMIHDSCEMNTNGGIILYNNGVKSAIVSIEIEQYFKPSFYSLFQNNTISSYIIHGQQSIVLDPTAGVYGYPGYDAKVTGQKIAFNPVTREYVYLE